MQELAKTYNPKDFEQRIYQSWEQDGDFHQEAATDKPPFTIVMPPPNITGQLHMGHALDQTLQDVLTRWRRMQGYAALWVPGTDHASIATEVRVADELFEKEGKTKEDVGREAFLDRVWLWREIYGGRITEQQRRLGDSCDWERERFTMDEGCNKAVVEFFVRLYRKGLIYRGYRMINWCPQCGTSLSDAEVEHEDVQGQYWYIRYPGADGGEGVVVATSRPETMFGDTAVAVHPDDARYKDLIGKTVVLPLVGREIPVVADPYPDPEKGTGAVKITPAHDPNDFEVGQRHSLPQVVCIDFEAKMTAEAGQYEGMDRYECRKAWVAALADAGFVVKTEDVVIPTGMCYRCATAVEPMLSNQWFVKMKPLAEPAIAALKSGELKFVPERFGKTYLRWMEEIRDWCISRQLWWGHRIPAWYCDSCGKVIVAQKRPLACSTCGATGDALRQDEDVLDTWFSSALWPFSTLGWPEDTEDLRKFYPTSVLVTGYDIIFFWVARMVFSGIFCMGKSPFSHVFIHGLVRGADGQKMSKSLGNGVDPLEIIGKYGADALRFMLLHGSAAGNDMRWSEESVISARNFANKLWNAARFVIMNLDGRTQFAPTDGGQAQFAPTDGGQAQFAPTDEDRWILATTARVAGEVTEALEKFELSVAIEKVYDLIRDEYCDWYIELVKSRLYGGDETSKRTAQAVLVSVLSDLLRLLHPFMPFITEEIWGYLGKDGKLIRDRWPAGRPDAPWGPLSDAAADADDAGAVARIEALKDVVRAVRNIRAEAGTEQGKKVPVVLMADAPPALAEHHIKALAGVSEVTVIADEKDVPKDAASAILKGMVVYVPLAELVDNEAEREKLLKERERLEKYAGQLEAKLANEGFTSKAPAQVVEAERAKLNSAREALEKTIERLEVLMA
ncbi:MAG: valine--tRNA ligase [Clostridiales Family XIII bacterium]|nr:valine--tRNA ligase [Clostridiales Family XIII bacterium]